MTDQGLEVCANSFMSALAAQNGGAVRVELCDNMAEGGTTPSYAQIKTCKERLNIQVWPIIRPRGGDFLYTDDEFHLMKEDIRICKMLHCDGVVTGILTSTGEIDIDRCRELIELAHPMPLAFHRAFDMCENKTTALEQLIQLGFVRVLSSGGAETAFAGAPVLAGLVKQADNRISIMPGAGIHPDNIEMLQKLTRARTFHASARIQVESKMQYRNEKAKMGSITDEYHYELTSEEQVRQLFEKLKTDR